MDWRLPGVVVKAQTRIGKPSTGPQRRRRVAALERAAAAAALRRLAVAKR